VHPHGGTTSLAVSNRSFLIRLLILCVLLAVVVVRVVLNWLRIA